MQFSRLISVWAGICTSFSRIGVTSTILFWLVLALRALPHQGIYGEVKTTLLQAEAWDHKSQALPL